MRFFLLTLLLFISSTFAEKPNIVWICIEDASPHIGCYGETAINTPNIDLMAKEGIKFNNAFVTAPVCSTSRSAMITGMFQMTSGFHLHRSQKFSRKGSGNKDFYKSYNAPKEIITVPELFKKAGYYTSNKTKTDYNFERQGLYDSQSDWKGRKPNQPYFAQFQLKGGKNRRNSEGVDLSKVKLPPYYTDDEVLRKDWVSYLSSWIKTDLEVAKIIQLLKDEDELENTYIFLWTDHGVSHIRGKQFLYEEGIIVPLIIRFPNQAKADSVRNDLVKHIDIPVSSLALAGIDIPQNMQGQNLFAEDYSEQEIIYFGRDRCDETVDIIRGLRTQKYKYIRNFLPDVSHMQPSQYKDAKKMISHSRKLFLQSKLNKYQAKPFLPKRDIEELYDIDKDPHELNNLAANEEFKSELLKFRGLLKNWMVNNNDMGLIPEPELEELGKMHGSKYHILQQEENKDLVKQTIDVIEAGERKDTAALSKALKSAKATIRYWAVRAIGNQKLKSYQSSLHKALIDSSVSVRIAAAESLIQLGELEKGAKVFANEVKNTNLIAEMYALRAIEARGKKLIPFVGHVVKGSLKSKHEFSKRIARRLTKIWKL